MNSLQDMEPMRPNSRGKVSRFLTQRTQRFSRSSPSQSPRAAVANGVLLSLSLAFLLSLGCDSRNQPSSQQRYDAAKTLFEQTTKNFHIPSAEAKGADRAKLLDQAAVAYQQLLEKYPDQDYWAAQSLRSLGNIRAAQTHLDEAIKHYTAVERNYPQHDFEVLMAWKAAADLLWDAGRREEAKGFYQKLVTRFDKSQRAQVVQTVVRGSRMRLTDGDLPGEK